jgi:hypothetical protein
MSEVDKKNNYYNSRFEIEEQVTVDFGPGGKLNNCIVQAITFEEGQIYYDIGVLVNVDIEGEPDGCEITIIRGVNSLYVKDWEHADDFKAFTENAN